MGTGRTNLFYAPWLRNKADKTFSLVEPDFQVGQNWQNSAEALEGLWGWGELSGAERQIFLRGHAYLCNMRTIREPVS